MEQRDVDWLSEQAGIPLAILAKSFSSVVALGLLTAARFIALKALHRRFHEEWVEYRARKIASYTTTVIAVLVLAWIWIDAFSDLPTFLGLISAGIAIALSDVLKNLAGWVYILSRRPFRVTDRIEIADTKGDVVDIRLFRFSLMEVGNWVDAEQATGRLIHVPNGMVFTNKVANYTEGFEYIWHEIPVLITFESDRTRARQIIERAVASHAPNVELNAGTRIRKAARKYHIKIGPLTSTVHLTVKDSGVLLTARMLVEPRQRRAIDEAIWNDILDAFDANPTVSLAYPTIRTYLQGPITIAQLHAETLQGDPRRGP
jgi:small-conductance mechanosensitive channel